MNTEKNVIFCSRDLFHKSVFGAVEEDRPFCIRLLVKEEANIKGAVAVFDRDGAGEFRFELFEDEIPAENGFYCRSANISLPKGLYFYRFIIYTAGGETTFNNIGCGVGGFEDGSPWQLTVYQKDFTTPDNIKGGIIYQIFPDRFYKGKISQPVPNDRILRDDWGGLPFYKNEAQSQIGKDFFGGNLNGIAQKLDYLNDLGVTMIYLNPIFESQSNHRYDTSNYMKIDPLLGSEKDFENLCKKAKEKGINIILDGVFSHTGDDSIYFNSKNRYNSLGAANSEKSPYFSWYKFKKFPLEYECWWGIKTLPEVNETEASYLDFISGNGGVISYWMGKGAFGFRLDVADELPDMFIEKIRECIKKENENGYLVGEVWEDASNKISYNRRRKFLSGKQLDSVMNYPFANLIIAFAKGGSGFDFAEGVMQICENYPKPSLDALMNHIGTHDTPRAITRLCGKEMPDSREKQAALNLNSNEYSLGKERLKCAALIQFTLPGIPALFYGDEIGLYGGGDPFCRGCFTWDNIDEDLLRFYKKLGEARKNCNAFKKGELSFLAVGKDFVLYQRKSEDSTAIIGVNTSSKELLLSVKIDLYPLTPIFGEMLSDNKICIPPKGFALFIG